MESQNELPTTIPSSLPTITSITSSSTCLPPPTTSTLTPHSDSSHCHTHSTVTSTAVDSTPTTSQTTPLSSQTTPTNSQTTPISYQTIPTTGTLTPLPGTPPPNQASLHHQQQEVEEHDREIQETALLLASMTGPQNILSPLKYLTQQHQQPSATDTSGGGNKSVVETARETEGEGGSISIAENRPVSGLGSSVAPSTCVAGNVASGGRGELSRSLLTGPSGDGVKVPHGIAELSAGGIEGLPEIECLSPTITVVRNCQSFVCLTYCWVINSTKLLWHVARLSN